MVLKRRLRSVTDCRNSKVASIQNCFMWLSNKCIYFVRRKVYKTVSLRLTHQPTYFWIPRLMIENESQIAFEVHNNRILMWSINGSIMLVEFSGLDHPKPLKFAPRCTKWEAFAQDHQVKSQRLIFFNSKVAFLILRPNICEESSNKI